MQAYFSAMRAELITFVPTEHVINTYGHLVQLIAVLQNARIAVNPAPRGPLPAPNCLIQQVRAAFGGVPGIQGINVSNRPETGLHSFNTFKSG